MTHLLIFYVKLFLHRLGFSLEQGQGLTEYALIIMLIAIAIIGALTFLGQDINTFYQEKIIDGLPF